MSMGANDYVTKPLDLVVLLAQDSRAVGAEGFGCRRPRFAIAPERAPTENWSDPTRG